MLVVLPDLVLPSSGVQFAYFVVGAAGRWWSWWNDLRLATTQSCGTFPRCLPNALATTHHRRAQRGQDKHGDDQSPPEQVHGAGEDEDWRQQEKGACSEADA